MASAKASRADRRAGKISGDADRDWAAARAGDDDPLLTALSLLAGRLGRPLSGAALGAALPPGTRQVTPELALRAAHRAGLEAELVVRRDLRRILPLVLPCILLLDDGNACVLLRFEGSKRAGVLFPEDGGRERSVDIGALQAHHSGRALFLRAAQQFDGRAAASPAEAAGGKHAHSASQRGWFWGTLLGFWPVYGHVLLASAAINCFALALPLFIMNVYDRVVPNAAIDTLWVLTGGVLTVFGFEFLLRNLRGYFVDVAGKNADVLITSRLFAKLLATPLDAKPPSAGAMANNLREFEALREFFTSSSLTALVDLPFVLLFISFIWAVAGPLASLPLLALPLVLLAGGLLQFPLRRVVERTQREASQKHAILVEAIGGLETIKASTAEGHVQRSWERFVGLTAASAGQARLLAGLATSFAQLTAQLTTVLVVVAGVYQIAAGRLSVGALVAATLLTGRALAPLGAIAAMLVRLQQSRVALRSLDRLMKGPSERPARQGAAGRPALAGALTFEEVSFRYPDQQTLALDGLSIDIAAGEKVGILGRIGSGKSTLARLIMGLYTPGRGRVLADGCDLRDLDPAALRRNVAYVAQDNYLFYGSLRENIAFGAPQADEETIRRAADIAGVTAFLRDHPQGLDLQVGERGMALSGGQRQAVAIARALLQDPPVLLLDEPTSQMDSASEAALKRRLGQGLENKTLILITHRASLLALVDRLIVLDGGRVVADGPRDGVLAAIKQGRVPALGTPAPQSDDPRPVAKAS